VIVLGDQVPQLLRAMCDRGGSRIIASRVRQ
jgi:hypothetical protein